MGLALPATEPPICLQMHEGLTQALSCPAGQNMFQLLFADFGSVLGNCSAGLQSDPTCSTASHSMVLARQLCLGKPNCTLTSTNDIWGPDPCPGRPKTLAVQAACDSGAHCYAIGFNSTFGDNMVLQQAPAAAAVFGTVTGATTNVSVTVLDQASGASYSVSADVGQGGLWKALLRPAPAGGNFSITATATCSSESTSATIHNTTFGDVWYCAG